MAQMILNGLEVTPFVGQRFWFESEKRPYRVRSCGERYIVLTKPFNLQHTCLYTIIDSVNQIRGTENLIFSMGFETDEDCNEALIRLESGETEVSRRNYIPLDVVKFNKKKV